MNVAFLYPNILWLLGVIPLLGLWYYLAGRRQHATLRTPSLVLITRRGWRTRLLHIPFILRLIAISSVIVALARPQSFGAWTEETNEGIDIMLTMDISGSMLAMDFAPNRVEAAKQVAANFVASREYDNIGLVAFSGESFTACPLTTDHAQLLNRLSALYPGMIEDRTAIGLGLVTAVNRLRESKAKSKVIILLTDGSNNAGDISPQTAADLARAMGITVHAIGMGTLASEAPIPMQSVFGDTRIQSMPIDIDEDTLKEIAQKTGGTYFRATNNNKLEGIYTEIDKLEKTKLKTSNYQTTKEEFMLFALVALSFLLLELILRHTIIRTNP